MLRRADIAHTPLWHMGKGGCVSYKTMLRAMYVFGCKIPLDAGQHIMGCGRDSAKTWYPMLRIATAFAELMSGRDLQHPDGILEFDATKTAVRRSKPKSNTHCGRFFVCYHRDTRQYSLEPLKDADVKKGAPPPPESYDEIKVAVLNKVHDGHIISADSGWALKKVVKTHLRHKGVVCATVVHRKKQFARVEKIPLKFLSARVRARVAKLPTTTTRTFRMKSGDQGAESVFAVVKRNLARMNLQRGTVHASVNFLSSAWLAKNVGLEGVAQAVKMYMELRMDQVSPLDAFKERRWLTTLESMHD